jgi:hypothetical protein
LPRSASKSSSSRMSRPSSSMVLPTL